MLLSESLSSPIKTESQVEKSSAALARMAAIDDVTQKAIADKAIAEYAKLYKGKRPAKKPVAKADTKKAALKKTTKK